MHAVLGGQWAGSEVVAFELANRFSLTDEVGILLTKSDRFPSEFFRKRLRKNVRAIFIEAEMGPEAIETVISKEFGGAIDVMHCHLGPASRLSKLILPTARKLAHLHIRFFGTQLDTMDGVIAISPWQLRDIPKYFQGSVHLARNYMVASAQEYNLQTPEIRETLGINLSAPLICSVGRLHTDKGMDVLIEAMKICRRTDIHCLIIGSGAQEEKLKKQVGEFDRIHFLGFREDVASIVKQCDLFISASRSEPFGLSTLEAMSVGVPVVATKTHGSIDLLGHLPFRLIPIENPYAMSNLIGNWDYTSKDSVDYMLSRYDVSESLRSVRDSYCNINRLDLGAYP